MSPVRHLRCRAYGGVRHDECGAGGVATVSRLDRRIAAGVTGFRAGRISATRGMPRTIKRIHPPAIISNPRPGASPCDFSWAVDHDQIGAYWHGYESLRLPESLRRPISRTTSPCLVRGEPAFDDGTSFQ